MKPLPSILGAVIVIILLLPGRSTATLYGCEWGTMYDPTPTTIEYYIEQNLADNGLGSMSGSQAVMAIRSALDKLHREAGALITFKYMGTTSTNDCTAGTSAGTYSVPTMIIKRTTTCNACDANESPACAYSYYENSTEMNCGWIKFVDNEASCPQNAWGAYGDGNPQSEDDIIMATMHEAMHVLRFDHVDLCVDTEDDESIMHGYASYRRSLSRADKRYARSHYGFDNNTVTYQYDDVFDPVAWTEVSGTPATSCISPVVMAPVDDSSRGVAFLTSVTGANSEMRAYICDPTCTEHTPTTWNVYSTPAIARSFGAAGDKWLIAGMYNDSMTTYEKDIRYAVRNYDGASWTEYNLTTGTKRPALSAAYDSATDKFILSYVNDSDEIEIKVAEVGSTTWYTTDTNIKTFEGATIACDEVDDFGEGNCVMAWANIEADNGLKWAHFDINDGTGAVTVGTVRSMGLVGTSRPSITNNLGSNSDPEFLLTFTQASKTMYMRTLGGAATSWGAGQYATADSDAWFGPGHVGYRNAGASYSYVYYAE